jgi:Lon-like ATP-dependent protease
MGVPADDYDIHVNFPGGGPIDGPSAGIAMATGIYSAIYKIPIDHTIAMTGEISIHGNVKPIGGIHAKVKAAKKAGARGVIIPTENMQSILQEIDGIELIQVSHLHEVFEHALMKDFTVEQAVSATIDLSKKESV